MIRHYNDDANYPEVVQCQPGQYFQEGVQDGIQVDDSAFKPMPTRVSISKFQEKIFVRRNHDAEDCRKEIPLVKRSPETQLAQPTMLLALAHRWKRTLIGLSIFLLILAIIVPIAVIIPRRKNIILQTNPSNYTSQPTQPQSLSNIMLNSRLATTYARSSSSLLFYQMRNGSLAYINLESDGEIEDTHLLPETIAPPRNNTPLSAAWSQYEEQVYWNLFYADESNILQMVTSPQAHDSWRPSAVGDQLNLKVRTGFGDMFSAFPGILRDEKRYPTGGVAILVCDDSGLRQITFNSSTGWFPGDTLSDSCYGGSVGNMYEEAYWARLDGQRVELWYGNYSDPEEMQWWISTQETLFSRDITRSTCSFDNVFAYVNVDGGISGSIIFRSTGEDGNDSGVPRWDARFDVDTEEPIALISNSSVACFQLDEDRDSGRGSLFVFYQLQNGTIQVAFNPSQRGSDSWTVQNVPT